MPSPLPYYNHYTADWAASSSVRPMSYAARGIYRELLDVQWEDGFLPGSVEDVKALLRCSDDEWMEFEKYLDKCFPLVGDVRRNHRMAIDREETSLKVEQARSAGLASAAARTKKQRSANEVPAVVEQPLEQKAQRNRNGRCKSVGTVVEQPLERKASIRSNGMATISDTDKDLTETKVSGENAGEKNLESKNGKAPNAAWSEVSEILGLVCESLGWDPPIEKDIRRNLKPDCALRQLAKLVGATEAADLFVYACREWKGHVSWESVFDKRNLILDEMKGREYSYEPELPKHVRNRREPMAGVDFYMGYAGESPVGGVMLRPFAIVGNERTEVPFDAKAWFDSRKLPVPEKYKQLVNA